DRRLRLRRRKGLDPRDVTKRAPLDLRSRKRRHERYRFCHRLSPPTGATHSVTSRPARGFPAPSPHTRPITTYMRGMSCLTCGRGRFSIGFAALSRAAAKAAGARLRRLGALATHPDWSARAVVCERCPVRVVRAGVSYCGKPFLNRFGDNEDRDPADGC